MAEHERATQNKQTEVDQKHRVRQKESEPSFDQFHAWDTGPFSLTETPFSPQVDKHAESLAMSSSDEARANLVLHLQQTYGNKYVQRLIESKSVQAKLTVNAPNDVYEQEADRVAEAVTRAVTSQTQRQTEEEEEVQAKSLLQRQVEPEEEEEEEVQTQPVEEEEELQAQRQPAEEEEEEVQAQRQEEEEVQAKSAEGQPDTVSENIEAHINNARGSGHPLSDNVREPMELAFGADFSNVRVHTDSEADALNQQLSARAFTTGQDVFFREGEYSPGSDSGRKLIAHELTHVVQQSTGHVNGGGNGMTVHNADDSLEQEADDQAQQATTAGYEAVAQAAQRGSQGQGDIEEIEGQIKTGQQDVIPNIETTPATLQTNHIQRVVVRTMDEGDWLYEANKKMVHGLVGGQIVEFGKGNDYTKDNKVAFVGHGEPGSLLDTRAGKEKKLAGFQLANELRQPKKEIKEGTEIILWSCHAGEKGPKMNFSLVENVYRWLTKLGLFQGHNMKKVKVSGVLGLHIPNPATKVRYAGPKAGDEAKDVTALQIHYQCMHCLAKAPFYEYTYTFKSSTFKGKSRRLYMGTPLSKPKDVKEEIKKDLVSAGKPSTPADIDKIYDQEVKDFYKDFTGDLDFGKIAGSITGGKTLVTEIGTIT